MASLKDRNDLVTNLLPRVRMALCAEIYELLRTAPTGSDAQKKALRIRQRWGGNALLRLDYWTAVVSDLIAGAAPDGSLSDGELSDTEIETFVPFAVEVCANVQYSVPTETLPE